jgi:endonuclease/exonuclease/phosphatase family metal-dependent hydrolase
MRLASYNVENLFNRAKIMNSAGNWTDSKAVLEAYAGLNGLLGTPVYSPAVKARIVQHLEALGLGASDTGPYVILRRNKGGLLKRPRGGGIEIVASGRADWVGSLDLIEEPIDAQAMRNTARAIDALNADVLGVVEAESRPALAAFNEDIMLAVGGQPFEHVMLIDGNDTRGIDVGVMTRPGFPVGFMRSHVDDRDGRGAPIFSRDCPVYQIATPGGETLLFLVNHLKSKGYGSQASSNARRKAQAQRVADIYRGLIADGARYVAVAGDFNDTPDSDPLSPLLDGTDLKDISAHPGFDDGGYPGTFGSCGPKNKIDFILLSPALFAAATGGGVMRMGMWPGVRPVRWEVFPELRNESDAASDHAALWADIGL